MWRPSESENGPERPGKCSANDPYRYGPQIFPSCVVHNHLSAADHKSSYYLLPFLHVSVQKTPALAASEANFEKNGSLSGL
jgi:hypothetical protein